MLPRRRPLDAARLARDPSAAAAVYMLLVGGLMAGIFVAELRLIGVALGIATVSLWARQLHRPPDSLDVAAAAAVALLAIGAAFSTQPRVSAEYVAWAIALVALLALLRRTLSDAEARDRLLSVAGWVAVGVAVVVAALWSAEAVTWALAGGPGVVPPLQLDYSDDWFRNVNVLPVYLALLAPGLVHLWTVGGHRVPVIAGLAATAVVTLLSASRAAWLGLALGAVLFGLTAGALPRVRPIALVAGMTTLAGLAVLGLASGILGALFAEATDFATVGSRVAIWKAALGTWLDHPIAGSGLGTMPSQLLEHGLAAMGRGPAPHAHSLPLQLLAEAGVVGVLAIAALAAGLAGAAASTSATVPRPVRAAAMAALAAFLLDGLADNHTALGAIAVLVVANAALLAPARWRPAAERRPRREVRRALAGGLVLVAAAVTVWGGAAIAWGRSQALLLEGRVESAARVLELAATLDPHLPLYPREVGKMRLLRGERLNAEARLLAAASLNPGDPNAWRSIGALRLANRSPSAAVEPLRRAVELDATQVSSHLLLGMALDRSGAPRVADVAYRTAALLQPRLLLSDGWQALGVAPQRLEAIAEAAWQAARAGGAASPSRAAELAVVRADREGLEAVLSSARVPAGDSWRAALAAETGDAPAAVELLARSEHDGRTSVDHWANAALVHALAGDEAARERDYRLAALLREGRAPATSEPPLAHPVTRDANDFWMYARSTAWLTVDVGFQLPDPQRGGWLRLHDPSRIELPPARAARLAPRSAAAAGSAR